MTVLRSSIVISWVDILHPVQQYFSCFKPLPLGFLLSADTATTSLEDFEQVLFCF